MRRLRWLGRLPAAVRYFIATLLVLVGLFLRSQLSDIYPGPFLLFIPSVIVVSLLFDRGTGIYACLLSAALAVYFFIVPPSGPPLLQPERIAPAVIVFTLVGLFTAFVIEALRKMIMELEEKNREVLEAERELMHAQKMEAVGRAVSLVAHDFKNILTPLIGSIELLKRHTAGIEDKDVLEAMELSCNSGKKLIEDILLYGRKEKADFELSEINKLVQETLEIVGQTRRDKISFEVKLEEGLPPVYLEPGLFHRALANLIENACDAMPEGGQVIVRTSRWEPDTGGQGRGYVCLGIQDTGTGIPAELQQKIFEPFFSTKPLGEGTGLGLAMVADFVRQANGRIAVDSAPGRGTEIRLCFPVPY